MGDTQRLTYVDYLRGLVIALMGLDHASYYLNSVWLWFDPLDPLFDSVPQFLTRCCLFVCAPGFLILAGAMVYLSYERRVAAGVSPRRAKWNTIRRGLVLIVLQVTWVNSSWSGFARVRLAHLGIIACIGISIALLALVIHWRWPLRLALAGSLLVVHPLLARIPYDPGDPWQAVPMETFITAGAFNKYPVIPWLALAIVGSVVAVGWFKAWHPTDVRVRNTLLVAVGCLAAGLLLRLGRGYGNLFAYSEVGALSFYLLQKYPPSLVHQLWTTGGVLFLGGLFQLVGDRALRLLRPLQVYGSAALFFYLLHIPILAAVIRRGGLMYRSAGLEITYASWIALLVVMYPLCLWFGGFKSRTRNPLVRMI